MKTIVVTDRGTEAAQPGQAARIEEISSLMSELMERAQAGDVEVGLNALLGAYVNVSLKTGRARDAAKALSGAAEATTRIDRGNVRKTGTASLNDPESISDLVERVRHALMGQPHAISIGVLLSLFRAEALGHSCCIESSAEQCALVADELKAATAGTRVSTDALH